MDGFRLTFIFFTTLSLLAEAVIVDFQNITIQHNGVQSSSNNTEARQAGFGFIKFEGETYVDQQKYGFIQFENNPSYSNTFEENPGGSAFEHDLKRPVRFQDNPNEPQSSGVDPSGPVTFQENSDISHSGNPITFQDDNNLEQKPVQKKRRRRRKRKPRLQPGLTSQPILNPGLQYPPHNSAGFNPELANYQSYGYPQGANIYGKPGYLQGQYRPPRRVRRPQQDALSTITAALTSVARYDDLQCVPRMLCEAAGGAGVGAGAAATGAGLLSGLQPLLTLLSAYNVVSASPLFVFGRAVFLGMTSKGNTATCRYAYSSCPTDPEQLVHYLNNHNGGFFRFFNSPQRPGQQNLQQFYNQLSTYGQQDLNGQSADGQNYGYYQPNQGQFGNIQNQNQNYGLYQQNTGSSNYAPDYMSNYPQGQNQYGFQQTVYKGEFKEIQDRIQNKPGGLVDNYDDGSINKYKLLFSTNKYTNNNENSQVGDGFKFPEQTNKAPENYSIRDSKVFIFPHNQNNRPQNNRPHQLNMISDNDYYNIINGNPYNNIPTNQYPNKNYASNNYANNYSPSNNYASDNYASNNYANNNSPSNSYASNNYPSNSYPNSNYPNNNYASNNYANNNSPSNNYASDNYASNNYANNNSPSNSYASNNYPSNNYANSNYPNNNYASNNYASNNYPSNNYASSNYQSNNYANNKFQSNNNQGLTTVYVIRGNGDPNKPEIVNLRPGESLTK